MKDIDFDELDRAVSSVLNKTTTADEPVAPVDLPTPPALEGEPSESSAPESPQQVAPVQSVDSTESSEEEPVQVSVGSGRAPIVTTSQQDAEPQAEETASSESVQTSSPAPSLATKRRGKFMDVMHPSHDMAPSEPAPSATRRSPLLPVSQNIEPEKPIVAENDMSAEDESSTPLDTTQESVSTGSDDSVATSAEQQEGPAYIDPIDFAAQHEEVATDPVPEAIAAPTAAVTPFIDDAQVEKRPLGAFGESEAQSLESAGSEADVEMSDTNDTDLSSSNEVDNETLSTDETEKQTVPDVSLPRELQPDVVQVESVQDEMHAATGVSEASEGHPLFDTSTYHEPVAAKGARKSSGWVLWFLGFLVCLAIGGGVGYFLFANGLL